MFGAVSQSIKSHAMPSKPFRLVNAAFTLYVVAAAAAAASVNVTSAKFVRNPLAKQDEFIVNGTTVRIMWLD